MSRVVRDYRNVNCSIVLVLYLELAWPAIVQYAVCVNCMSRVDWTVQSLPHRTTQSRAARPAHVMGVLHLDTVPLYTWFAENATYTQDGVDAVALSVLGKALSQRLPPEFPRTLGQNMIDNALTSSIQKRGSVPSDAPIICKVGGKPHAKSVVTLTDVVALLWDQVTLRVDQLGRGRVNPYLSKRQRRYLIVLPFEDTCEHSRFLDWAPTEEDWAVVGRTIYGGIHGASCADEMAATSTDDVADFIVFFCTSALNVHVNVQSVIDIISPLCTSVLEPSVFLAKTIMRGYMMDELLGATCAIELRRYIHCDQFGVPYLTSPVILKNLVDELVETRSKLAKARTELGEGRVYDASRTLGRNRVLSTQIALRRQRKNRDAMMELNTATLNYAVDSKIAFRNCPDSLHRAEEVARSVEGLGSNDHAEAATRCISQYTIARHCLTLDAAIDAYTCDRISRARDDGTLTGFAFSSDESPPAAHRFSGLRFQVTYMYLAMFEPILDWDSPRFAIDPPIRVERHMAHCNYYCDHCATLI